MDERCYCVAHPDTPCEFWVSGISFRDAATRMIRYMRQHGHSRQGWDHSDESGVHSIRAFGHAVEAK